MYDVCVVGSANLDLVATCPRLPTPGETVSGSSYAEHAGGKGLNQAVAARRTGASVAFVAAIGDDEAGRRLLDVLAGDGIDRTAVAVDGGLPTGRALIMVDARGENSIVVVAGANRSVAIGTLPAARVVLVQLEISLDVVDAALRAGRATGATTILNPAPAAILPADLLACCDIVIPNEHEGAALGGADHLLAQGVATVVTTRGAEGIDVVSDGGRWRQDPITVEAVDATAAGDACCGALAARLAAGDDLRSAVRYAAAAGALATTRRGAVPSLPHRGEVERLLAAVSGGAGRPPSLRG